MGLGFRVYCLGFRGKGGFADFRPAKRQANASEAVTMSAPQFDWRADSGETLSMTT